MRKVLSETAMEWDMYLDYLHDWIEEHKSDSCYGCSPACFDEWQDCEEQEG